MLQLHVYWLAHCVLACCAALGMRQQWTGIPQQIRLRFVSGLDCPEHSGRAGCHSPQMKSCPLQMLDAAETAGVEPGDVEASEPHCPSQPLHCLCWYSEHRYPELGPTQYYAQTCYHQHSWILRRQFVRGDLMDLPNLLHGLAWRDPQRPWQVREVFEPHLVLTRLT